MLLFPLAERRIDPVQSEEVACAPEADANDPKSVLEPSNWQLTFCMPDEQFISAATQRACHMNFVDGFNSCPPPRWPLPTRQ
jgi:hypothetical protein